MSNIPDTTPAIDGQIEAVDDLARTALALHYERKALAEKLSHQAVGGVVFVLAISLPAIVFLPSWAAAAVAIVAVLSYYLFARRLIQHIGFFAETRANQLQAIVEMLRRIKIMQPDNDPEAQIIYTAEVTEIAYMAELDRSPGGRPRNEQDDWAWQQVHELGRDRAEVYTEWAGKIGPRLRTLKAPKDSFNQAIRRRRRPKGP